MTTPLQLHDPAWLADVCAPGPHGQHFGPLLFAARAASGQFIMQDDTQVSLFAPGAGAYAGYSAGVFSNMSQVRIYAASQGAHAFAYSGFVNQLSGADALDIEPGLASVSDAVTAYKAGIRYFYGSASWISQITGALAAAGITRSMYKIISAHYIGSHICSPGTCGYPQADATQFTSSYLGRSLDATLCPSDFFGSVTVPPPAPAWPLVLGSTGADVVTLQKALNATGSVIPLLIADGNFGPLTLRAVKAAQAALQTAVTGSVDQLFLVQLQVLAAPPPTAGVKVQVEYFKPGFGWVLAVDVQLPPSPRFRYRWAVSPTTSWTAWTEVAAS